MWTSRSPIGGDRGAQVAHGAARPRAPDRRLVGLGGADALDHVAASAAGELAHPLDRRLGPLLHDIRRAEALARRRGGSGWWPSTITRSAPRRRAASTAHRPTAPSPTTATVPPGPTPQARAPWCPVPITSVSVDERRRQPVVGEVGAVGHRAPGCRRRAGPARPRPGRRHGGRRRSRPRGRASGSPRGSGRRCRPRTCTERSPAARGAACATSAPTSSTTPMNSWPSGRARVRRAPSRPEHPEVACRRCPRG